MAQKRPGLGKGFGDLFARTDEEAPHEGRLQSEPIGDGSYFAELPLHQVSPNPRQPRSNFDEDELAELAESIREFGVLQPVVVRGVGDEAYELVMGERRFRASRLAGQSTIPAIVRGTGDDALLRDALLENLHRADLNPLEEAAAYQQLLDDFGCTKEELSRRIHRSRPQVSNTLRLLKLPARVQRRVAAGVLSAGHARALLGLPDASAMELLADRIVAEGLSVRSTEEVVALGERGGGRSPSSRVTKAPTERESMVGRRLSDRLDTRVKVQIGKSKGRITIEFSNEDDLERIVAAMENRTL